MPLALKHNLAAELAVCAGYCCPQPALNQRPVRLPPQSRSGTGDRRSYLQRNLAAAISRKPTHKSYSANVVTYCELVSSPEQIPQVLAIAMRKVVLTRGVSVVVLPGDVALKPAPEGATTHAYHAPQPVVTPEEEELRKLAQLLRYSSISP